MFVHWSRDEKSLGVPGPAAPVLCAVTRYSNDITKKTKKNKKSGVFKIDLFILIFG